MTTETLPAVQGGTSAEAPMLKLTGVNTYYGRIRALQGIDLEVGKGEIVTLIGANGAGKTTTLSRARTSATSPPTSSSGAALATRRRDDESSPG